MSTRIVILGGGFGGVYTALHLEKMFGPDANLEITLVNSDNFFLFTPMLHEIAASDVDLTAIVSPIRTLLKRATFFAGDVIEIDLTAKRISVAHGYSRHTHDLTYDYLVIALGSITNFYGLPGLADRALTMKSLGDAIHLRNRLIAILEEADAECAGPSRQKLMTFVVAGGGFAGVETIAAINDFVREALKFYRHIPEELVRMVLVHAGPVILPELGEPLGTYAQKKLTERRVEIHTMRTVAGLSDEGVTLSDGSTIVTDTLVWTAGTSPHPLLRALPCLLDRGRIMVNEYLEVAGYPGVWALGDCAVVPDLSTGKPHPPTAQHAIREGAIAAKNIGAALGRGRRTPFTFKTIGQLAAIGRRTGVARIFGFNFSGFVAWWLWRTIYLSKLPRFEKKLRVALDWTLDLFFSKDLVQYLTERAPSMSHPPSMEGMTESDANRRPVGVA